MLKITETEFTTLLNIAKKTPLTSEEFEAITEVSWSITKRNYPENAAEIEKHNEKVLEKKKAEPVPAPEPMMTPEEAGKFIEDANPPSPESIELYKAVLQKYGPDATFGQVFSPDK